MSAMKELSPEVRDALGLLTPAQVAALLQVSTDWVYDETAKGRLPALRLGRSIRFRPLDLQAWMTGEWKPT